jgi:hypothetical protein
MSQSWGRVVARRVLRWYPRRWRERYETEMQALLADGPVRWRDVLDLARSAAGEWEREIARGPLGPIKIVIAAYVVLMTVFAATAAVTTGVVGGYTLADFELDPRLLEGMVAYLAFGGVLFLTGLFVNLPLLAGLRLARRWIAIGVGRALVAAGLAAWAVWRIYLFDWYDGPWRHGFPGIRYLAVAFLPIVIAFGSAGAIIGGAVVRPRRSGVARGAAR